MSVNQTANDETQTLIIGTGIAGLMTALSLAPHPVVLVSKGALGMQSSSQWAQGGISAALAPGDSADLHSRDTLAVAGGIAYADIVDLVTRQGPDRIKTLSDLGVMFDRDGAAFSLRKEAAHSHRRVVHANGDSTGQEIMRALTECVRKSSHITLIEHSEAIDLIIESGVVSGATILRTGTVEFIRSQSVVLATGGIGQVYSATTNPTAASGDGLAMAARAGAKLQDVEFVQFHPTAIDVDSAPLPLATEALRGEGALLVNDKGHRFMVDEHPQAELAPRDAVARGIWRQIQQGRTCYLDTRQSVGSDFQKHFPTVFAHCADHNIDPTTQMIPVIPAAHYHMGGIATDARGRTSLQGLWACGEVACTGLHGANRLASNSLLEAAVFGPIIADDILKNPPQLMPRPIPQKIPVINRETEAESTAISRLQALNYQYIGLCREASGLLKLLGHLNQIEAEFPIKSPRLTNLLTCSLFITTAALQRRESRGGHYRLDFPDTYPDFKHSSLLTLQDCRPDNHLQSIPLAS
ncbi:MAG: L-aspartate oxidase [Sneathiella sp.]